MNWDEIKDNAKLENFNHYEASVLPRIVWGTPEIKSFEIKDGHVLCIDGLIANAAHILECINNLEYQPVAADGDAKAWKEGREKVSGRSSTYDRNFSEELSFALQKILPSKIIKRNLHTSCVDGLDNTYSYCGINPYLRFVKYDNQKRLASHYDGHYKFSPTIQTAMTCLIYLTTSQTGHTVFLKDELTLEDKKKTIPGESIEVLSIQPIAGRILFFDQYLLHATKNLVNEEKSLILTDMVMSS